MLTALESARGIWRSYRIYYGDPGRRAAMDALNRQFVRPGDLVFDIGSHVGDRIGSFRRCGGRVVAAEPQRAAMLLLRLLYGRDGEVTLVQAAVGAAEGVIELKLNPRNPTISTASDDFIAAASNAKGWEGQQWTRTVEVPMTTLDALIARHGLPRFAKIDVEGFEKDVLAGLSQPVPALSFEFTTIQKDVAFGCLERLEQLGTYQFNAALGESHAFFQPAWITSEEMRKWVTELPEAANSGDIYARLA